MEGLKTFASGTKLLESLKDGDLTSRDVYVGMVKVSKKDNHVAFTPGSCDEWIDVPAQLIADVEVIRHAPCREHSHPVVRLKLSIDESNPVHAMVRHFFSSPARGTQAHATTMPNEAFRNPTGYSLGPEGQELSPGQAQTGALGRTRYPSTGFYPVPAEELTVARSGRFATIPGRSQVTVAARRAGGGPGFILECDLDCCADCCRDCFPWGCHDYPCCELKNCKIKLP